ncbi:MAG TPA: SHD1 domain-containing protein, partial [Pirellula sp.]|nr:SHD1 domain-containing protein [Pirellula sp.]
EPKKAIEKPSSRPLEEKESAKAKEQVDELDALFGVGAFAPPSEFKGAEFRQWIDNSGAYQVKARLAVIYVDKVKLMKENGKFTTVPLSRLSDADFGYVSWVASNLTTEQTARMVKTESQPIESDVSR